MQEEIHLQVTEKEQRIVTLECSLADTKTRIGELGEQLKTVADDKMLLEKLIRDLETRTYLIDQLNDESTADFAKQLELMNEVFS